jgi:hypothetical protein
MADDTTATFTPLELGTVGLEKYGNIINEEFLVELRGVRGAKTYRQMALNDATVGAILFAIKMIARSVSWNVDAGGPSQDEKDAATFVNDNIHSLDVTWEDQVTEFLSFLEYGWSFHEEVYEKDKAGRVRWKKLPIRAQDTLYGWEFDSNGNAYAMIQSDWYSGKTATIPFSKGMLFRTSTHKNNPEGQSILRTAYRSYYLKRNLENLEGIGVERDSAGIPVIYAPAEIMAAGADSDAANMYTQLKKMVVNLRNDEQAGIILPMAYDENNNPMYKLELLNSGGSRQFNVNEIISRYDHRIAATVLADLIFLGSDNSAGSWALGETKSKMLHMAIENYLKTICSVFNRFSIPRLMSMNTFTGNKPTLTFESLKNVDLNSISRFIQRVAGAGIVFDEEEQKNIKGMIDPKSNPQGFTAGGETFDDSPYETSQGSHDKID